MSGNNISQYKREIDTYKQEIQGFVSGRGAEIEQDNGTILQEITSNINAISQGNDLVKVADTDNISSTLQVDYNGLPDKINEFTDLLKSLVSLYLKQESLDQFLRITISDNKEDLSHIKSEHDPRYRNLESQVKILKEDNVDERENEIKQLRNDINAISEDILTSEQQLDDITRDTERELDECEELLKELNDIQEIRDKQLSKLENKEFSEIQRYEDYINTSNEILSLTKEQTETQEEINNLNSNKPVQKSTAQTNENLKLELKHIQIENTVINKLIEIQENHMLSNFGHGINDLKFTYHDTKKEITFQCQGKYQISINLNLSDNTFEKIVIVGDDIKLNTLTNDISNKFIHSSDIFNIINYTSDKLKYINL